MFLTSPKPYLSRDMTDVLPIVSSVASSSLLSQPRLRDMYITLTFQQP
ncbi:MAG: hypothetical protein QXR59_00485 [Candidatus Bathyarchaeia archaeon]